MAEHPIIFQGEMVRAIYAKLKWQTRRVFKSQPREWSCEEDLEPGDVIPDLTSPTGFVRLENPRGRADLNAGKLRARDLRCPYGVPGDTLWVRETWCEYKGTAYYKAEGAHQKLAVLEFVDQVRTEYTDGAYACQEWMPHGRWKPSIHMPRWASRLDLLVTKVRVERVQGISDADCEAEGLAMLQGGIDSQFRVLWDSINAKRGFGWDVNPYVWCVDFEVKHA